MAKIICEGQRPFVRKLLTSYVKDFWYIYYNVEQSYDNQGYSNKRPIDESDGYEQQTKKMRVEPGDGPNTLLRILVNSKVGYD